MVDFNAKESVMQSDLSEKQRLVLNYIEREMKRTGRAPSLRQAAAYFGVSHAAVRQMIASLEEKGYLRRERYSRSVRLLARDGRTKAEGRWVDVPRVGRIAAGLPLYAQQEWDGSIVVDASIFRGANLFALMIRGDSMTDAGILNGDIVICEPRQYAAAGDIVVALINGEEATVKRFYLHDDSIELRPENKNYNPRFYKFNEILIQGKVVGLMRGPEQFEKL